MQTRLTPFLATLLAMCVFLSACATSTVPNAPPPPSPISVLENAVTVAENLVAALPTSILSAADKVIAANYFAVVNPDIGCAVAAAQTQSGLPRVQAIANCLATSVSTFPGLPPTVQLFAALLNTAVQGVLSFYSAPTTTTVSASNAAALQKRLIAMQPKLRSMAEPPKFSLPLFTLLEPAGEGIVWPPL